MQKTKLLLLPDVQWGKTEYCSTSRGGSSTSLNGHETPQKNCDVILSLCPCEKMRFRGFGAFPNIHSSSKKGGSTSLRERWLRTNGGLLISQKVRGGKFVASWQRPFWGSAPLRRTGAMFFNEARAPDEFSSINLLTSWIRSYKLTSGRRFAFDLKKSWKVTRREERLATYGVPWISCNLTSLKHVASIIPNHPVAFG